MKYIIADRDMQNGFELKKMLDCYETFEFQGSYTTFSTAANYCLRYQPDIAFVFLGNAELNAFRLARELREKCPLLKVIFISSQKESAVEAFEHEADGFLLVPFNNKKIGQLLQKYA